MRHANISLALGGDTGNTVPKLGVTVAEIAVLRAIHGEAAVTDIEPLPGHKLDADGVRLTNRGDLQRLRGLYGGAKDTENNSIVNMLFPGAAARVMEEFDELEMDPSFYKAESRVAAKAPAAPAPLFGGKGDHDGKEGAGGAAAPNPPLEGLHALTIPQLRAVAEERKVDLGKTTLKAEIIALIEAAPVADEEVVDDAAADDATEDGEGDMPDTGDGGLFK